MIIQKKCVFLKEYTICYIYEYMMYDEIDLFSLGGSQVGSTAVNRPDDLPTTSAMAGEVSGQVVRPTLKRSQSLSAGETAGEEGDRIYR